LRAVEVATGGRVVVRTAGQARRLEERVVGLLETHGFEDARVALAVVGRGVVGAEQSRLLGNEVGLRAVDDEARVDNDVDGEHNSEEFETTGHFVLELLDNDAGHNAAYLKNKNIFINIKSAVFVVLYLQIFMFFRVNLREFTKFRARNHNKDSGKKIQHSHIVNAHL
jgi:hypothetical protein